MLVTVQFPGDDFSELLIRHEHNEVPARYPEEARYTPVKIFICYEFRRFNVITSH